MADRGATSCRKIVQPEVTSATDSSAPLTARGEYNRTYVPRANESRPSTSNTVRRGAGLIFTPLLPDPPSNLPFRTAGSMAVRGFSTVKSLRGQDDRPSFPSTTTSRSGGAGSGTSVPTPPSNVTTYYKMRARDPDCGVLTYRTWVVSGAPDTTGAQYTGARCGASPLADITIVSTWQVSS